MKFLAQFVLVFTLLFFTGNLVKGLFTGAKTEQAQTIDDDSDSEDDENDSDEEVKLEIEWFFQTPEAAQMLCSEPVTTTTHFDIEQHSFLLKPHLETNHQPPEC